MSGELSVAEDGRFATAKVADDVLLDSRLALYHETQRWLAVSDLHLGSDPSASLRPDMLAMWGSRDIEKRLNDLIAHYQPRRLIINGDVMNHSGEVEDAAALLQRLSERVEVIGVAGNHDHPSLVRSMNLVKHHLEDGFVFHHGHQLAAMFAEFGDDVRRRIHITGHSHPMFVFNNPGEARKRLPVFVEATYPDTQPAATRWVLPAFAPWASGAWPVKRDDVRQLLALEPAVVLTIPTT